MKGHLAMVQWLHANHLEGCAAEALNLAIHFGHVAVVEWLRFVQTTCRSDW